MKWSKNAVTSPAATTITMGSASTTAEAPATSGIPRASASLTIQSALWIALRVVRRAKNHRISSTRFSTPKDVQSIPRATTRCGSARSCANPSSQHLQLLQRKNKTKMIKMTRKTVTVSNSNKTSSMSYLEEILTSPSGPRSYYSDKFFQLSVGTP